MIEIVFGSIEVAVHSALCTEIEDRCPMGHSPWRSEKSFNDASSLESELSGHKKM
jgi:hypothetical protein